MDILYIDQYFKNRAMVGGCRSFEMARRLVAHGHRVNLITTRNDRTAGGLWRSTVEEGVRVHWAAIPYSNAMLYRERLRAFLRFAWSAGRYGRGLQADVVFASSTPLTVAWPAVALKRALGVPMVFEVRDLWPESPIAIGALRNPVLKWAARRLERFAYGHAARVVALSPGMKEGVCRAGYPAARVHVIPNCCDTDLFRVPAAVGQAWRQGRPEIRDRPMILYAGTLGRINGVGWLAALAAQLQALDPEVCFVVVGDGAERERVRAEASRLGVLGVNFFMLPPVTKAEMPELLSACSLATSVVLDIPQLWHNSANKFFDALAAGRPVAINHPGWQAEILTASGAGLVLPAGDLPTAARLLWQRVRDVSWLQRAGAEAARLAGREFARDRLALELETVLMRARGAIGPTN